MSGLFLITGLGNPGSKYTKTRHNAGFWFLDALRNQIDKDGHIDTGGTDVGFRYQAKVSADICRARLFDRDCILAKPTVFMNHSGQTVRALMDYYRIADTNLLVAYDELDLPPGTARIKQGGGHGGHNGMRDIFRHVDSTDFMRLRIGIGHPGSSDAVSGYVLSRPTADQEQLMLHSIGDALAVMSELLAGSISKATKDLHTADDSSAN